MSITVHFSKNEEETLRSIASKKDMNVSVYIRKIVNEKIEEEIDKEFYKKAIGIISDENSEFIAWDEALKELNLNGE